MLVDIVNCTFKDCTEAGIYGLSAGLGGATIGGPYSYNPILKPTISNCVFDNTGDGIKVLTTGNVGGPTGYGSAGSASPRVVGSIFKNLSGAALNLENSPTSGASQPIFENNTVVASIRGVVTMNPYDVIIRNNIFTKTGTAIRRTGTIGAAVHHNLFFGNSLNFDGYPVSYGQITHLTDLGFPVDIASNIFHEPGFENSTNLTLSANSAAVDGGDPGQGFNDGCLPPARGSTRNDIGAYGGPQSCSWSLTTEAVPATVHGDVFFVLKITGSVGKRYSILSRLAIDDPVGVVLTNIVLQDSPQFWMDPDPAHRQGRFYSVIPQ